MFVLPGYCCLICLFIAQRVAGEPTPSGEGAWPGDGEGGAGSVVEAGTVGCGWSTWEGG